MMRWILCIAAGIGVAVAVAASFGVLDWPLLPIYDPSPADPRAKPELGGDLYSAAAFPPIESLAGGREPITLRGYATLRDKQDVPSGLSGQVLFVGVPVPDAAVEAAGAAAFMTEPFSYTYVQLGKDKIYKFYRRLLPGQSVDGDQVVAMIECSKALTAIQQKQAKIEGAIADAKGAKAAADEARARYDREIAADRGSSPADRSLALATWKKSIEDHNVKLAAITAAEKEMLEADNYYNLHHIRNKINYGRCVIQHIYKGRGDAVKEQETIMVLNSLEHLLAEALVDGALLDRIKPENTATLEPTQEMRPASYRPTHRSEVTAVAVTKDADVPRIVSGGLDRVVMVQEALQRSVPVRLIHDAPVHALVCSPATADHNLCLVASGHKIYLWNLDRKARSPMGFPQVGEPFEPHSGVGNQAPHVTALAFSPDGTYFATGADDGSIAIWKTADFGNPNNRLVYRFDADHGVDQPHSDPITTLAFTPQSQLVSAARDNTIRVWKLKEKGADLQGIPIAGRTGSVGQLGVRADGKWHLFDKDNTLQFFSLQDPGAPVSGVMVRNHGVATPFETIAQFSPDGSLILTAGLADGRMQLWKAPTEHTRGFEVRQFTTEEKQPTTCAAFAPRTIYQGGNKDQAGRSFAVSGNANGDVYVWTLPTTKEVAEHRIENVKVSLLSKTLDPNTHQARIAVDVPNPVSPQYPDGRLIPGKAVTVVIGEE